jgi:hypothetical protein
VLIGVIRAHLDTIGRFVDAHAETDPLDTSEAERWCLYDVQRLLGQALDRFS